VEFSVTSRPIFGVLASFGFIGVVFLWKA